MVTYSTIPITMLFFTDGLVYQQMTVTGIKSVPHGRIQLDRGKLTKMASYMLVGLDWREVTSSKPTESLPLDKNKIHLEEGSTHLKATSGNSLIWTSGTEFSPQMKYLSCQSRAIAGGVMSRNGLILKLEWEATLELFHHRLARCKTLIFKLDMSLSRRSKRQT